MFEYVVFCFAMGMIVLCTALLTVYAVWLAVHNARVARDDARFDESIAGEEKEYDEERDDTYEDDGDEYGEEYGRMYDDEDEDDDGDWFDVDEEDEEPPAPPTTTPPPGAAR